MRYGEFRRRKMEERKSIGSMPEKMHLAGLVYVVS